MLTDWLIYLDFLEENNFNTSFLRLITPITFGIFECHSYYDNVIETHYYNYTKGSGSGYGYGFGSGYGYGDGVGNGKGFGYGYYDGDGDSYYDGDGFIYSIVYDEEN